MNDRIRHAEERAAGHGAAAPSALVALHEFLNGASIDDLRHVVGLTPSGAVRLIDKLSESGLVARRPGRDLRSVSIVLTRRGHETARRVLGARRQAASEVLAQVHDPAVTSVLEDLLAQLTALRLHERAAGDAPAGGWLCRLCDFGACGRPEGRCPVANVAS
jgi:DNA-binding MarR family transcriptional regulator